MRVKIQANGKCSRLKGPFNPLLLCISFSVVDCSSQGADIIYANKQPNLHVSLMAMFVDS